MAQAPTRGRTAAPDLLDDEELAAWRGFLRVHADVVRALDEEMREAHGLPLTAYEVLMHLLDAPQHRLRMRELADAVLLSRSGLTRLVDRLVRDGLITREACPDDARGSFAVLTDAGASLVRPARATHLDGVRRRFLAYVGEADRERLGRLWARVLAGEPAASQA